NPGLTAPRTTGGGFGAPGQAAGVGLQAASVAFQALPRFNSILVAAPKGRLNDIIVEIKRLDGDVSPQMRLKPFPLKRASASKVSTTIQNFWNSRWTGETALQHQVRITYDDSANQVYVQAAPADMEEISDLILRLETTESIAVNEVRIRLLSYIPADEL